MYNLLKSEGTKFAEFLARPALMVNAETKCFSFFQKDFPIVEELSFSIGKRIGYMLDLQIKTQVGLRGCIHNSSFSS
jgi:hypothetical protein